MASQIVFSSYAKMFSVYFCFVLLFSSPSPSEAKRKAIEEIPRRQLETLITSEDYLAVFWRKLNCVFWQDTNYEWNIAYIWRFNEYGIWIKSFLLIWFSNLDINVIKIINEIKNWLVNHEISNEAKR